MIVFPRIYVNSNQKKGLNWWTLGSDKMFGSENLVGEGCGSIGIAQGGQVQSMFTRMRNE